MGVRQNSARSNLVAGKDEVHECKRRLGWKKKALSYEVVRDKTKLTAKVKNGKPEGSVLVKVEGDIGEMLVPVDITNLRVIQKIERQTNREIEREIERAIKIAQRNHTDIFGFGDAIHRHDPKFWKRVHTKWSDDYFPTMNIKVEVRTHIRRSELRTKSFLSTIKEEKGGDP